MSTSFNGNNLSLFPEIDSNGSQLLNYYNNKYNLQISNLLPLQNKVRLGLILLQLDDPRAKMLGNNYIQDILLTSGISLLNTSSSDQNISFTQLPDVSDIHINDLLLAAGNTTVLNTIKTAANTISNLRALEAEKAGTTGLGITKTGNAMAIAGAVSDIAGSFMPEKTEYNGPKGDTTRAIDTVYNGISNASMTLGPVGMTIGGAMKVGTLLGKGVNALGGGTDGMCVCAGTKVFTSNGKVVNIEDLKQEDGIIGWNLEIKPLHIDNIIEPCYKECLHIEFESGNILECSVDHPILLYKGFFQEALYLKIGNLITVSNYPKEGIKSDTVVHIIPIGVLKVYNLSVTPDHTYLANGIITHNTTTDAILGSSFLNLSPIGLINGFGGKKADTITKNLEAFDVVGASYTGSDLTINSALLKSGKKYGLFSSSARRKANEEITEAKRQQDIISGISNETIDRSAIRSSMSAINGNRRLFNMIGGYNQAAIRAGKHGLDLKTLARAREITKKYLNGAKVNNPKENSELVYNDPEIIAYIKERFPKLSDLEINILNDPTFTPRENADEGRENYGDLEYVSKKYSNIPYYKVNGITYKVPDIAKGKSVTIYNNNLGDKANEWIALDILSHGLRDLDKYYQENLLPMLEKAFRDNIDDALAGWVKRNNRRPDKEHEIEIANNALDAIIRDLLVKDGYRESYHNTFEDAANEYLNTPEKKEAYLKLLDYINKVDSKKVQEYKEGGSLNLTKSLLIADDPEDSVEEFKEGGTLEQIFIIYANDPEDNVEEFKEGGSFNVIPEGALHARLHNMENADNLTKKGIPVVIEKENGELEQLAEIEREEIIFRLEVTKKLEELAKNGSDEAAIEAGKILTYEILNNTIDHTNNLL